MNPAQMSPSLIGHYPTESEQGGSGPDAANSLSRALNIASKEEVRGCTEEVQMGT